MSLEPQPEAPALLERRRPTIGCVVPAYNEAMSIAGVLDSMLSQTCRPDAIHVIVNNTTDDTARIAAWYAGVHEMVVNGERMFTEIHVHDLGTMDDKKVGALNYGFRLVDGMDYLLGIDGDTSADPRAVEYLVQEMETDPSIGGISAIYSIDDTAIDGLMAKFLICGQRAQFSAFNMRNLLNDRQMAVLGGQLSIFSMEALHAVVAEGHQIQPWLTVSEVEDSLLSLQIQSAGYKTMISKDSRANVGGMLTMKSLDAQQVKWNYGCIDLMWPGVRNGHRGQPFHPNLRIRWLDNFSMLFNGLTRLGFFTLLTCSLLFHAFVFTVWWAIPPVAGWLLNIRIAHTMGRPHLSDYLFAGLFLPAELYTWVRLGHFVRAWSKFFFARAANNWELQAQAESGSARSTYLVPFMVACLTYVAGVVAFDQLLSVQAKSDVLWVSWRVLGAITVFQTFWMAFQLLRPYKGYKA
ncbi:glycosyltransferase [Nocardioides sp. Kera G14]|uniref:glycosyltransferase n=1 Tax=Nocardioides sp. Kera G14 TaxID=2884264 RepID=UPI001D123DCB|nr:glycosyltransferase [Nocardioides sp. Kera G14]UDY25162.1 glycosyltransferase [Nocardioides sp. Kera G14]